MNNFSKFRIRVHSNYCAASQKPTQATWPRFIVVHCGACLYDVFKTRHSSREQEARNGSRVELVSAVRDRPQSPCLSDIREDTRSYIYSKGDSISVVSDKRVGSAITDCPWKFHSFPSAALSNRKKWAPAQGSIILGAPTARMSVPCLELCFEEGIKPT
jgi:hypothetical protein